MKLWQRPGKLQTIIIVSIIVTAFLICVFRDALYSTDTLQLRARIIRDSKTFSFLFHNWTDKRAIQKGVLESPSLKSKGVIYNRVGKCGSRSVIKIIQAISAHNNFKLIGVHENLNRKLTLAQQIEFVTFVDNIKGPFIYHQHIRYVNFRRFAAIQPYYINLIRDPVERLVSNYYFRRFGDGRAKRKRGFQGTALEFSETFDDCVQNNRSECTDATEIFYLIPCFCGQRVECSRPSKWALREAKYNVINNYLVVGILEEFENFLVVLEKILPRFFRGAVDTWKSPGATLKQSIVTTSTNNKKKPSPSVIKTMRKHLQLEYEFYKFIKRRFYYLKAELGIVRSRPRRPKADSDKNSK